MHVWMYFAFATAVVLVHSWLSRRPPLAELGTVMAVTWCASKLSRDLLAPGDAAHIYVLVDAFFGLYTAYLVMHYRSITAAMVFGVFLAMVCVHWVAFALDVHGGHIHLVMLNVLYALQLTFVMGGSVAALVEQRFGVVWPRFAGARVDVRGGSVAHGRMGE